jgi:thymidylate kinase
VLGVLKEVLNNSHIPKRYQGKAARAVQADWQRLSSALAPLGEKGLVLFRQMILAESGEADVPKQSKSLRRALVFNAFYRSPVKFIRDRFLHGWAKVRRYIRPSGAIVTVLGVDGVGKSTVINAIKPVLEDATHGALEIKHLRPGLLPPLARLKGKHSVQSGPVLEPHGSTPSGAFGSILRLAYLTADYVLGYWLLLRPTIAKSPTVILFDRYYYDMALDPRRFRLNIGRRVIKWFTLLIPKPDVVLCLHAEPEAIMARKQELPLPEITRQVNALCELAQREPRAILISTEDTVEVVRNRVLGELIGIFRSRCCRQMN